MSAVAARNPLAFLPGVAEKLGWYVYALRDPRDGTIFYVGKGLGQRVYAHARDAQKIPGETAPQLKLDRIRAIHGAGLEVGVEIVRHGIESEAVAYEVEAAVIDGMALAGINLTNLVAGHDVQRGWQPLEEIVARYAAQPAEIEEPVVLIRVANLYRAGMDDEALYKSTREWWRMGPRRTNAEYAFAVFGGIVRAVYRIDGWENDGGAKPRWSFNGVRDAAMEDRYLWTDVTAYLPTGSQNPIRYVNC